ncbi:MAG: hypothetical protein HY847_08305 [Betaproteobacteria bacterium]|nr:hypothetical protein [Betaproteobacteria bacterium]
MKSPSLLLVLALFSVAPLSADALPANHPKIDQKPVPGAPATPLPLKGRVVSVINVPQYTYLEVMQNAKVLWIAVPTVVVKKGDVIRFDEGMAMGNFHSKTLNRTFPSISFVSQVVVTKEKE